MELSLFDSRQYEVDSILEFGDTVTIRAHTVSELAICPDCGTASGAVHSYYERHPRDLPILDKYVDLQLAVRRFRCRAQICKRKTFAERLELVASYQQRTERLTSSLKEIGFSLGGEAGAALLPALHMQGSSDTLLRLVKATPIPAKPTPRVLGVDDWAICRGRCYGTILVDLETREPIDLLPDRSSDTIADWLEEHPGVEIVTRDRSTEYAHGITLGAPTAIQIADRWHLLRNLQQMAERWVRQVHHHLQKLGYDKALLAKLKRQRNAPYPASTRENAASQASRKRRIARYEQIQAMKKNGQNIKQIAAELNLNWQTVKKYFSAEVFPERSVRPISSTVLDPYLKYLQKRLDEGCENGKQLWREIQKQGYTRSYQQVRKWLQSRRSEVASRTPDSKKQTAQTHLEEHRHTLNKPRLPGANVIARLLTYKPDSLTEVEQLWVKHVCQDGKAEKFYQLAQRYIAMICERQASNFPQWVADALASSISTVVTFTQSLQRDYDAIQASLDYIWSNGQVEGQVNRLKLIKRQMYGRASFQLLRARVLHRR